MDWRFNSYMTVYMLEFPFSQIIPPSPSPTESKSRVYTSVSFFLSCIQGRHCHLPKFHIYVLVYCIGVFLSGLQVNLMLSYLVFLSLSICVQSQTSLNLMKFSSTSLKIYAAEIHIYYQNKKFSLLITMQDYIFLINYKISFSTSKYAFLTLLTDILGQYTKSPF